MKQITFEQSLYLKHSVAVSMKKAKHKASRILKAYVLLMNCEDDLKNFYYEVLKEYIDEHALERIALELSYGEHSYTFWINSIIEDIHYFSKPNTETDFNNKTAFEDEVRYAFYCFTDKIASLDQNAIIELLKAVLEDSDCKFLEEIAFIKLNEYQIGKVKKETKNSPEEYKKLLELDFNPKMIYKTDSKNEDIKPETKEPKKIKENLHEVQKILRENNKVVSSKTFKSESEAKDYVENMQKDYPDLFRIFDFRIIKSKN